MRTQEVYRWGVNHQRDLNNPININGRAMLQKPGHTIACGHDRVSQLELEGSLDWGIHRIHFYRVLFHLQANGQPVTHIHQYYAQWRSDHGLVTGLLLR